MTNKQSGDLDAAAARYGLPADEGGTGEISLRPYLEALWGYRMTIGVGLLAVLAVYVCIAVTAYVLSPTERLASTEFRLLFDGAERGQYPNGTKFSAAEIVSAPVLTEVFKANDLQRFGSFETFKEALFVQQSNPEIDMLSLEYQAKLADSRLTAVDRARLEDEFRKKREALTDPRFALTLRRSERLTIMPRSLMEKILSDTLSVWARQADERKGATKYNIPMFSRNLLNRAAIQKEDYLIGIDMLRAKARRVMENIGKIAELPGANAIRATKDNLSLAEVRANLEDVVRFKLEPLTAVALAEGLSKNRSLLALYAQGQLFQVRLAREESASRVKAYQDSLREYSARTGPADTRGAASGAERGPAPAPGSVIPQLSESFLDRLIALSTEGENSDIAYRQKLTTKIIEESVQLASLDRETSYYEGLTRALGSMRAGVSGNSATAPMVEARIAEAFDGMSQGVDQVLAIYQELATHNLNPSTLLYTVTSPYVERVERSFSRRTVVLYGVLLMIASAIVLVAGCLIHYAVREGGAESRRGPVAAG